MPDIPHDGRFDSALDFVRDPYRFIKKRSEALGSDLFQTRVLFQSGICVTGPVLAKLFYDEKHFKRAGVAPRRFQKTLFGKGGVQGLDGAPHKHRKNLFMSLMHPDRIRRLGEVSAQWWKVYARRWQDQQEVVLYDALCEMLARVACQWAEVPLSDSEVGQRSRELTAMFDYAGTIGPKHWWARIARGRAERWIESYVQQVRSRHLMVGEDSALFAIAMHRDLEGNLLPLRTAAVEILNVLRPTVAVAVYLTLSAHALAANPAEKNRLVNEPEVYSQLFAQEVRRFYPFFPAVGAKVREEFQWQGYTFPKGTKVLLDLYGTNHDARVWESPDEFRPERFRNWDGDLFTFVPQGGGDANVTHRCPGDPIATELLRVAAEFMTRRMTYELPPQDLELDFVRVPALPRSKMKLQDVRLVV